jgi:hypothetical protein
MEGMELSESAVAHIALDQMITANLLLTEIENVVPVPALQPLQQAIMMLMSQFRPEEAGASEARSEDVA